MVFLIIILNLILLTIREGRRYGKLLDNEYDFCISDITVINANTAYVLATPPWAIEQNKLLSNTEILDNRTMVAQ